MKTVQVPSLEKALETLNSLDENELMSLMADFSERQPAVLAFVMDSGEEFEDEADLQLLLEMVMVVWMAFLNEFGSIAVVREDQVTAKENKFTDDALRIAGLSEEEIIEEAMELYNRPLQPVLMSYIYEELADYETDRPSEEEEDNAMVIAYLHMVVELFDDAINKPNMRVV
jgi:hypothetical protein